MCFQNRNRCPRGGVRGRQALVREAGRLKARTGVNPEAVLRGSARSALPRGGGGAGTQAAVWARREGGLRETWVMILARLLPSVPPPGTPGL